MRPSLDFASEVLRFVGHTVKATFEARCWDVNLKAGQISLFASQKSGPRRLNGKPRKREFCVSVRRTDRDCLKSKSGSKGLQRKLLQKP